MIGQRTLFEKIPLIKIANNVSTRTLDQIISWFDHPLQRPKNKNQKT